MPLSITNLSLIKSWADHSQRHPAMTYAFVLYRILYQDKIVSARFPGNRIFSNRKQSATGLAETACQCS